MVDVTDKSESERIAVAEGSVRMKPATLDLIEQAGFKKGDVLGVSRLAGIMAAKKTSELIPLCHPLPLSAITVEVTLNRERDTIDIKATVKVTGRTGVEMEALTAVSIAALTVYDMVKAVDRGMEIQVIRLVRKSGGGSGTYARDSSEK